VEAPAPVSPAAVSATKKNLVPSISSPNAAIDYFASRAKSALLSDAHEHKDEDDADNDDNVDNDGIDVDETSSYTINDQPVVPTRATFAAPSRLSRYATAVPTSTKNKANGRKITK
jgi:hypothetical protein